MLENNFQRKLKKEIKERYPDCYVLKNDPTINQGIPDLTILYKDKWASLEVKKDKAAAKRPNQSIHVARMNDMSYAAFIYPENKEDVLHELDRHFEVEG